MTAAAAVAYFLREFPALPPEAAPVFFLLCAHDHLAVPGVARRLDMAQSTAARLLALLSEGGLAMRMKEEGKAERWALTAQGRAFAETY